MVPPGKMGTGGVIRVGVVAPAVALRAGLRVMLVGSSLLLENEALVEVTHEASSLEDLDMLGSQIDVLLVSDQAASGSALKRALSRMEGNLAILLITDDLRAALNLSKLPLRAWGILPFDVSAEELLAAVYALHTGLLVGTATLLESYLNHLLVSGPRPEEELVDPLSERESQILQLLASGLANKQIAASLGISEHTVKFHVSSIYTKLGVTNRAEAVRIGIGQGLIPL